MQFFTLEELCKSSTAKRLGLTNYPQDEKIISNLNTLVEKILDPARRQLGSYIIVNSGYRCPEVNEAVGGVKNSAHMRGCASDIYCKPQYMEKLWNILRHIPEWDQLIRYSKKNFFHVSYETERPNRKQIIYK